MYLEVLEVWESWWGCRKRDVRCYLLNETVLSRAPRRKKISSIPMQREYIFPEAPLLIAHTIAGVGNREVGDSIALTPLSALCVLAFGGFFIWIGRGPLLTCNTAHIDSCFPVPEGDVAILSHFLLSHTRRAVHHDHRWELLHGRINDPLTDHHNYHTIAFTSEHDSSQLFLKINRPQSWLINYTTPHRETQNNTTKHYLK